MLNKLYGVWGLGQSGIATIKYLIKNNVKFIVYDDNQSQESELIKKLGIEKNYVMPHDPRWSELDYIIKSPGIPLYKPHTIVAVANSKAIPLISDIELFYLLNPDAIYVGITGTNGKSTTAALIGHILKENGFDAVIGGNIGVPVMELRKAKIYVLELSSYQLASINLARFNVSIILNISPDHLDWHGGMEQYIADKYKITKNQTDSDIFIYNASNTFLANHVQNNAVKSQKFAFYEDKHSDNYYVGSKYIYSPLLDKKISINTKNLQGKHNCANSLAALIVAEHFKIKELNFKKSIDSFPGLKHRMQYIGSVKSLSFYNDSKATNFDSLEKALDSFSNTNLLLILGGKAKGESNFGILKRYKNNINRIFLIGESSKSFSAELEKLRIKYTLCNDLTKAFKESTEYAKIGLNNYTILLSPGCASFDQWKNFEERGDAFIKLAEEYINANKI